MSGFRVSVLALIAFMVPAAVPVNAGFIEDGVPVYSDDGFFDQKEPRITPDGSGGAIIVWQDEEDGYRIVAQRVDQYGHLLWPEEGVVVCDASMEQYDPLICPDGAGGAIIAWGDNRNKVSEDEWDIYGQRLDADGVAQWTVNGVEICTAFGSQWLADLVTDDAGGAIVAWEDWSSGIFSDIVLQRIGPGGAKMWGTGGVLASNVAWTQEFPSLQQDGAGGVFVTYEEYCDGCEDWDIYAQRVGSDGQLLWQVGGVPICTEWGHQYDSRITSDGAGGAVIVWTDYRRGDFRSDLYAQRVDAAGARQWAEDGVPVCTASENQETPFLVPDGTGGAIITWGDHRNLLTTGEDIYAQRLNGSGVRQWGTNGVPICTAANYQWYPQVEPDGAGGAVIAWSDWRTGVVRDYNIYAQRVDPSGAAMWAADGISVCSAVEEQGDAALVTDGAGGVIIAWEDNRWMSFDIYAARIAGDGTAVATLLAGFTARLEGGKVRLEWTMSGPVGERSFIVMRAPGGSSGFEELDGAISVREECFCSFVDDECDAGMEYSYRVDLVEGAEQSILFETEPVAVPAMALTLHQNRPNPFNPSTAIAYYLPERSTVRLVVYDVVGRVVTVLVDREEAAGPHSVHWNGLDSSGRAVSAGVYIYRLEAGKRRLTRKMIVVR